LIKREIYRAEMENNVSSGVVVTGGTALLDGVTEIAEAVLGLPSRLGKPRNIIGLTDVVNNPHVRHGGGAGALRGQKDTGEEVPHSGQAYLQQHHSENEEMV
jgi:cell division ATPase FtsA